MTTKADTRVKWFHSGMADAPVLSGQAGALIDLLDACLINGFSTRTPDNISVSDGVATVNISAGNPYEQYAVIVISGASNAALNAEWRIDSATASSFTFLCPGVSDGAVTGASVKRAGGGWLKPFSGSNLAAYQSASATSTQLYLRVDDNGTTAAQVRGYENMTGISTGTGLFPTVAQRADTAALWQKSSVADSTARDWAVVSDGTLFFYAPAFNLSNFFIGQHTPFRFGDIRSRFSGDAYHCIISIVTSASVNPGVEGSTSGIGSASNVYIARDKGQIGGSVVTGYNCAVLSAGLFGTSPDSDLTLCPMSIGSRGVVPGMYLAAETVDGLPVRSVLDMTGVPLLRLRAGANVMELNRHIAFDITRPWR
jgi:hypothetical protein